MAIRQQSSRHDRLRRPAMILSRTQSCIAGWHGFDPTNNKMAGSEHISVAVSRAQEKASPISGTWTGAADAFIRLDVSVQVVAR
jgi:transglutaminase-like putative cysteine protease